MKRIFLILSMVCLMAAAMAQETTIRLTGNDRLEMTGDSLIIRRSYGEAPLVGYHVKNDFKAVSFRYCFRNQCWYLLREDFSRDMYDGFRRQVVIKRDDYYFLSRWECVVFCEWLMPKMYLE